MKLIITGAAGFVGYHLTTKFLSLGHKVLGVDNINDYYDVNLKFSRLNELGIKNFQESEITISEKNSLFSFIKLDIDNEEIINTIIRKTKPDLVIHLAAQAGVRYSITNPKEYVKSNLVGFFNVIDACKKNGIKKFIYASSSSVYGDSLNVPFLEEMNVDKPISLYASTKRSNELMAYTYSHLYDIQTIGLRFFTVYGPYGRPDMAYFSFTKAVLNNESIQVFNEGNLSRDFTYIDDIVNGIQLLSDEMFSSDSKLEKFELLNIGNSSPIKLLTFINTIEEIVGKKANLNFVSMQAGDVHNTYASVNKLLEKVNYKPNTTLRDGLTKFIEWYKNYYNDK
ncbi:MAG: NAD-dependent epimerase/dehydratase family protein [Sediminibacterium sp.]|jgi:UDP-glucuronate 4-epimerase|uniref:NAD-dependent epimerase/dehydratase family protein n=1 Tax=Sediminibacterium sp. TaxID=1917865 RepID=UPI002AB8F9C1|nr:NAD-dependent epimerase/dehydratase family protein [Sediminibacterium sp.]MDZ4070745.1 NAD-dependent epimerase/dehydratase family protein [Sediminibacterium sp.]